MFGFEIPNEFVLGYGLDFKQEYRNIPYIGIMNLGNMIVKTNHKHKKKYGQNFLDDNQLLREIEEVCNISKRWKYIRNESRIRIFNWCDIKEANLISFEIDDDLIGILNKNLENLIILH